LLLRGKNYHVTTPRVMSTQDSDHSLNFGTSRNSPLVVNEDSYESGLKSTAGKIVHSAGKRNYFPREAKRKSSQIVNVSTRKERLFCFFCPVEKKITPSYPSLPEYGRSKQYGLNPL
jgi:hypothetical protein